MICVIAALYILNNSVFKQITTGFLREFFICYFNDLMAPMFILAYTNILLRTKGKRLCNINHILPFCLCMGCIWEFLAPIIKQGSVTDPCDIFAYMLGGSMYWIIERKRGSKDDFG